jgi:hypothetical protein
MNEKLKIFIILQNVVRIINLLDFKVDKLLRYEDFYEV